MQSSNPVFNRRGGLHTSTPSPDQLQRMYDAPSYAGSEPTEPVGGRMTLDDVVARTAMTLGIVILTAAATWVMTDPSFATTALPAMIALGLGLFISFKHVTNPVAILAYAAIQGVFVGALSELLNAIAMSYTGNNIIMPATMSTLCVAAVMLALYKFRVIRVTPKFTKFVIAASVGFLLFTLFDFMLSMFGAGIGWNGLGTLGLISSIVGAGLAALMLMLDFDYIERAVADGAPQQESWFAAFGLSVTLIWLYIELLRIFAILNSE